MRLEPAPLPLIGRRTELDVVQTVFERIRATQRGGLLIIVGEAGIGKSRLLEEALKRFASHFLVLRGKSWELKNDTPLFPLRQVYDHIASAVDHEVGVLPDRVEEAMALLLDEVERCAAAQPTLVALEDLHWADPESVVVLQRLEHRAARLSLLLLITMRYPTHEPRLERLVQRARAVNALLHLGRLTREGVRELVTALAPAAPVDQLLTKPVMRTGNPLLIREALSHLDFANATTSSDVLEGERQTLLTDVVAARLDAMSQEGVYFVQIASLLGSHFTLTDVATVVGVPASSLMAALEEALRQRILVAVESEFAFRHDLIRDAVYASLPAPTRHSLHRQAALALHAGGAPGVDVASHIMLGARRANERDLRMMYEIGLDAARSAPATGARVLRRALALDPSPALELEISTKLIDLLMWGGELKESENLARDLLLRGVRPPREARLRVSLSHSLHLQGNTAGAIHELETALLLAEQESERASINAWMSLAYQQNGTWDTCRDHARAVLDAGTNAGELSRCQAHIALALADLAAARGDDALKHAEAAASIANESGDIEVHRMAPALHLGECLRALGRFDDAIAVLQHGIARADRLGIEWPLSSFYFHLAWALLELGELDAAQAEIEAGLSACDEAEMTWAKSLLLPLLARIRIARNELRQAEEDLGRARDLVAVDSREAPPLYRVWLGVSQALVDAARGRDSAAMAEARAAWAEVDRASQPMLRLLFAGPLIRLMKDQSAVATEWIKATAEVANALRTPSSEAVVQWLEAFAAGDGNALAAASQHLKERGCRFWHAYAAEDAGVALTSHDPARAIELLRESRAAFAEMGASREVARVNRTLRKLGVRSRGRIDSQRPSHGWGALTATQRAVAELIIDGLTYRAIGERLFISARTVETHARHAFGKLGVSSRVELAARYGGKDLPGQLG